MSCIGGELSYWCNNGVMFPAIKPSRSEIGTTIPIISNSLLVITNCIFSHYIESCEVNGDGSNFIKPKIILPSKLII